MNGKEKSRPVTTTDRIAGLSEFNDIDAIEPKDLWCDKGTAFPGKLLNKFKRFKEACALIRAQNKEFHQIIGYLTKHSRVDPSVLSRFDDSATLSHLLMIILAKFEE